MQHILQVLRWRGAERRIVRRIRSACYLRTGYKYTDQIWVQQQGDLRTDEAWHLAGWWWYAGPEDDLPRSGYHASIRARACSLPTPIVRAGKESAKPDLTTRRSRSSNVPREPQPRVPSPAPPQVELRAGNAPATCLSSSSFLHCTRL